MADIEPLRDFIRRQFLFDADARLGDDDPLFPDVIDSLGVMEVVDFIERHYEIQIGDDELVVDNFSSLQALSGLIDRQRDGG